MIHIYKEQARFLLLLLSVSQTASFQSSQSASVSVVKEVTGSRWQGSHLPQLTDKTYGFTTSLALTPAAFFLEINFKLHFP